MFDFILVSQKEQEMLAETLKNTEKAISEKVTQGDRHDSERRRRSRSRSHGRRDDRRSGHRDKDRHRSRSPKKENEDPVPAEQKDSKTEPDKSEGVKYVLKPFFQSVSLSFSWPLVRTFLSVQGGKW